MNYKKQILTDLIERYEASDFFRTGKLTRRIFLSKKCFAKLNQCMESPDEKQEILYTLKELSIQGLLFYSWVKHEKGNLIDQIWLNTQPEAIEQCYLISGKTNGRKQQEELIAQIGEAINNLSEKITNTPKENTPKDTKNLTGDDIQDTPKGIKNLPGDDIRKFLVHQLTWIKEKHKIPRYFTGEKDEDQRLLDSLIFIAQNEGEITERVLSSRLYGDSKIFERILRAKVLRCLRTIEKEKDEEDLQDEEVLQKYGIVRWPETMEFCGNLIFKLDNGTEIDNCNSIYGAYLNSDTAIHLQEVHFKNIKKVLFIENKANYIWYIRERKQPEELVIFHGGFYSPSKGRWFEKLYQGSHEVETWKHWSDIDLGGFRIFHRLKNNLIPELTPYQMDAKTLLEMESQCIKIKDKSYLDKLKKLLENPEYDLFHDVISLMLKKKVRLEQEQLL